jgi:ABC-type antimicrobial peptide transport system permease subunit
VFYLTYMLNELRRRKGRTLLTSLGLAVGVGLVVVVNALSTGLDQAQAEVLQPLTGVGTDMSVTRPISFDESAEGGPFGGLSEEERAQLREENGGGRLGLRNLGEPGTTFSRDELVSSAQLSFPATEVTEMEQTAGVAAATGALTLNAIHISGTVPEESEQQGQPGVPGQPGQGGGGLESLDLSSFTVTGVDAASAELGIVTAGQVTGGRFLRVGTAREAVLNASYASRSDLGVGDTFSLGGKTFTVVGLVATPLGGQASDVYVQLSQLQSLSGRTGRVNTALVRATSADVVDEVAAELTAGLEGAEVTTASDLAERVSGSLVDARSLAGKLGTALAIVGLLAAFLIAALLTLSSVNKRVRELGTLKAIGWSQRLVVRQVTGEALLQGLLGGLLGVAVGLLGVIAIDAVAPTLQASVAAAADAGAPRLGPGAFGQGAVVEAASTEVELDAAVSADLVLVAVALAVAGGLFAGAVGGLRAARLRPAAALRHID